MFKYMNKFTLRPKDLLIYAVIFLIIDIIISVFSGITQNTWLPFLILGLLEAFSSSSYVYRSSNDNSEE